MFYTYLWLREDGTPYYAGKGTKGRAFRKNTHRFPPPSKDRIVLQEWETEREAFEAEKLLISYYGREDLGTGCLLNLSDGGEWSTTGYKPSKETLERLRTSHLGQKVWNSGTGKGIYKRDNGPFWKTTWRVAIWSDGKLKNYGTFKTKEEAEQRLAEIRKGGNVCKDTKQS